MDFKSALKVFFDYIFSFRMNGYKNLIFFNALASSQHNSSVKESLQTLWNDTTNILGKVLQHGKDTGELKQDFSIENFSGILLSYIGGSAIFSFDNNFEQLKDVFINMVYSELKAV
ncbi:MAG: TetR family transcriptional regulator C-terminal domain-containing protein [Ruminococcus sp.]